MLPTKSNVIDLRIRFVYFGVIVWIVNYVVANKVKTTIFPKIIGDCN